MVQPKVVVNMPFDLSLIIKSITARILRGLRIVARLGFRFSKETATAIRDLSSSVITLEKVFAVLAHVSMPIIFILFVLTNVFLFLAV